MDGGVQLSRDGHVAQLTLSFPPHNFVDESRMARLADVVLQLDEDDDCRAIVLASGVASFCAGADFSQAAGPDLDPSAFYQQAMRLFRNRKPVVAAVAGPAIGGGLGLALTADFRVTCPEARFSANFNRLGIHPGFGLSHTLPRLVGEQWAARLFYTGQRLDGTEAVEIGLADELVARDEVLPRARALAREIASSAPLAVQSTRATLRKGWVEQVIEANRREREIQVRQFHTEDFREGVAATAERRTPRFLGR
jgi:enoyl-CoA hydratase/carnithine racemase